MKPLLLFDVDGTIAESGQNVGEKLMDIFEKLQEKYDLGIVGGGKYEKIMEQIHHSKLFTHIFSECGCVYHKGVYESGQKDDTLQYKKNIREHPIYSKINILVKHALNFLSNVRYTITGNFIDLRNGIIYISLIGMSATQEERKYFTEIDKKENIRNKLIRLLQIKAMELSIHDKIKILEGGSVGVGIYPIEYGKAQVLEHLTEYTDISYFGDKYTVDGNDYEIITHKKINGFSVNSVDETADILQTMFLHV
jgi:phosphomannomutase